MPGEWTAEYNGLAYSVWAPADRRREDWRAHECVASNGDPRGDFYGESLGAVIKYFPAPVRAAFRDAYHDV